MDAYKTYFIEKIVAQSKFNKGYHHHRYYYNEYLSEIWMFWVINIVSFVLKQWHTNVITVFVGNTAVKSKMFL